VVMVVVTACIYQALSLLFTFNHYKILFSCLSFLWRRWWVRTVECPHQVVCTVVPAIGQMFCTEDWLVPLPWVAISQAHGLKLVPRKKSGGFQGLVDGTESQNQSRGQMEDSTEARICSWLQSPPPPWNPRRPGNMGPSSGEAWDVETVLVHLIVNSPCSWQDSGGSSGACNMTYNY
jgi:hypothetical protein